MRRKNLIGILAMTLILGSLSLFGSATMAQEVYPAKDLTLICNSAAGGGYDIFARMVAPYLGKYLKELSPKAKGGEIRIKNMPGASGLQAYEAVLKAKPDGYTLGDFNSGSLYAMLYGSQKVGFDPRSYTWLFALTKTTRCLISSKKGIATWEELVARSKKEPLTLLVPQYGTTAHLDCILFVELTKLSAKIVATEGTADCVNAVIRGDADAALVSFDSVTTIAEAKEVNTLVSFTQEKVLPWVPTIVEKGFPECTKYMRRVGRHYMAPPKLDAEAERLLVAAGRKMLADPKFVDFLIKRRSDVQPIYGKELKATVETEIDDIEKFLTVYKKFGL
jgi:tripartite-type tricarboxylate transporter receptor subunit TctC